MFTLFSPLERAWREAIGCEAHPLQAWGLKVSLHPPSLPLPSPSASPYQKVGSHILKEYCYETANKYWNGLVGIRREGSKVQNSNQYVVYRPLYCAVLAVADMLLCKLFALSSVVGCSLMYQLIHIGQYVVTDWHLVKIPLKVIFRASSSLLHPKQAFSTPLSPSKYLKPKKKKKKKKGKIRKKKKYKK